MFHYQLCFTKPIDFLPSDFLSLYSAPPERGAGPPSDRSIIKKMGAKPYPSAQIHGRMVLQGDGILVPTGTGSFGKTLRERGSLVVSYNECQGKE